MGPAECLREGFCDGVILDGRFKTISPINHGSFGMVFMAKDMVSDEMVAIKCLTKKTAAQDAGFDFAIDDESEELALHSHLGLHRNIVNLIHSFETEAHVYLVLEYCPRGDLYEAIRNRCGPLETEHVRRFMIELVDAVAYIHSKGVFHRDIKPENIFLSQSGAMKLGDFGLATTETWTQEATVGSDRYMSPEQYDSAGAGYSPAHADIWAIGICLLNILFSRNPFTTPTESDPLFLDFSRDKQSLFDVFPSMSQDTYEVIVQCMNLDPSKRSLDGARRALKRVVSFTTLDEALDDFCADDRRPIPTSNREPLRTPSVQSPLVDQGAFPWSKALQASPQQPIRRLSAIADDETYSEELFPKSEESTDWFSRAAQTPSMSSILDSNLAVSMKSLAMTRPDHAGRPVGKVPAVAGSLPITMSKPRVVPSLSVVFGGRKDAVSKSWSDMWEEDAAEEEEQTQKLLTLKELNSRTWSHESKSNVDLAAVGMPTSDSGLGSGARDLSPTQGTIANDIDGDMVVDGFFFQEPLPVKQAPQQVRAPSHPEQKHSPPSKRDSMDKWAALGERRRAYTNTRVPDRAHHVTEAPPVPPLPQQYQKRQVAGLGAASAGATVWDQHSHQTQQSNLRWIKDRPKECPWNKGRDWNWNWRKEKRFDFGDVEWVGGWQEAHS